MGFKLQSAGDLEGFGQPATQSARETDIKPAFHIEQRISRSPPFRARIMFSACPSFPRQLKVKK
jgi:hypothetical protein